MHGRMLTYVRSVKNVVFLALKWAATRPAPIVACVAAGAMSVGSPFMLSAYAARQLDPMDRFGQIVFGAPTVPSWTWNLAASSFKTRVDATYRTVDTVPQGYEAGWREYYEYSEEYLSLLPQWATDPVQVSQPTRHEHHVAVAYGWPVRSFVIYARGVWANPRSYTYYQVPAPVGPAPLLANILVWSAGSFVVLGIGRAMFVTYRLRISSCPSCGYRLLDVQSRCPECGSRCEPSQSNARSECPPCR